MNPNDGGPAFPVMSESLLAVIDRLIGNTRTMVGLTGDPRMREHLREGEQARAALAELIERDKRVRALLDTWKSEVDGFRGYSSAKVMMALCAKELRAALQGGAK